MTISITPPFQTVKAVPVDAASANSNGHSATAKKEIQGFTASPVQPVPNTAAIPSNHGVPTALKTILYQPTSRRHNTFKSVSHRRSWTDSRDTFQNTARREFTLLSANHRWANHLVTLKYLTEFTAFEICAIWFALRALLKLRHVIAFAVAEITTRSHVLPDGSRRYFPINRIHYHILVDSDLSERQLRGVFNRSCLDAGLMKGEFEVQYEPIRNRREFEHKCKYILKFDTFAEQAILFQPGTGINKVCSIGRWFINPDGTRANKDKMWKSIVAGWYQNKAAADSTSTSK